MPRGEYRLFYENAHERDARCVFEEDIHKYYVDGREISISVSGVWGQYFEEFDPVAATDKYFANWCADPFNKYYQLIKYMELVQRLGPEEQKAGIRELWSRNGTASADSGTEMHANIEKYLNDEPVTVDVDQIEFAQFLCWRKEFRPELELKPYRTEWSIFDEELDVAGQIDAVFIDKDGGLWMVDWKRCNPAPRKRGGPMQVLSANMECFNNERGLGPCACLLNTKFSHYVVQQNLYKWILEHRYGKTLKGMYLAQFHPALSGYHAVEVPAMPELADAIMQARRDERNGCPVKRAKTDEKSFF